MFGLQKIDFFDRFRKYNILRVYWKNFRPKYEIFTKFHATLEKITMVVTTNFHCKSVIIGGTIFYIRDYYNHIVESTIIILYYIFLVDIAIQNIFHVPEVLNVQVNESKKIYFFRRIFFFFKQ